MCDAVGGKFVVVVVAVAVVVVVAVSLLQQIIIAEN